MPWGLQRPPSTLASRASPHLQGRRDTRQGGLCAVVKAWAWSQTPEFEPWLCGLLAQDPGQTISLSVQLASRVVVRIK